MKNVSDKNMQIIFQLQNLMMRKQPDHLKQKFLNYLVVRTELLNLIKEINKTFYMKIFLYIQHLLKLKNYH